MSGPGQSHGKGGIGSSAALSAFARVYGASERPRLFQAPGRVNLIGEHTDYNDGYVMPAAIDFKTWIAAGWRNDSKLAVHSVRFDETRVFDLNDPSLKSEHHWSDYILGVALELRRTGLSLQGANLAVYGDVPLGAGLSSSASLEVATAYALASIGGGSLARKGLALLCQRAENDFVGARVGIMDPFVAAHGQNGHALMLDCRSLDYDLVPLPQGVSLVICNTMVKHQLASGEYNIRRRECEEGVAAMKQVFPDIRALRDVSLEMLDKPAAVLSPVIYRRCRHIVSENARVLAAADALREAGLPTFGELMYQSHASLRNDYEVSCPELDLMVTIASGAPGVVGARMTGGGFGGCTVNIVKTGEIESFSKHLAGDYSKITGTTPEIYVTTASEGVREITGGVV